MGITTRRKRRSISRNPEEWLPELKNEFRKWQIKRECNVLYKMATKKNTSDTTIAFADADFERRSKVGNEQRSNRLKICFEENWKAFFRADDFNNACQPELFDHNEWEQVKADIQHQLKNKWRFMGACRMAKSNNMAFEGPEADKMVNFDKLLSATTSRSGAYDPVRNGDTLTCRMYSSFASKISLCHQRIHFYWKKAKATMKKKRNAPKGVFLI